MSTIKNVAPKHYAMHPVYLDKSVQTRTHVFIRIDGFQSAFDPRYSVPHKVLK